MHLFDITLRHDIPDSDWAYGMNLNHRLDALSYRLTKVGCAWEGPYRGSLYAEQKDVLGLTVRATVSNVLTARSMWDRDRLSRPPNDPIGFIERRDRLIGPIFSFQVPGKF